MVESSKKQLDFNVSDIVWSMVEHVLKTDQEYLNHISEDTIKGPLLPIEDSLNLLDIKL
jgi:hypothetical protein